MTIPIIPAQVTRSIARLTFDPVLRLAVVNPEALLAAPRECRERIVSKLSHHTLDVRTLALMPSQGARASRRDEEPAGDTPAVIAVAGRPFAIWVEPECFP